VTTITLDRARRIAVAAQLLAEPRPTGIVETVEHLGSVQTDPTNAVARTELLVLWSRLGGYDVSGLRRLLSERALFEYWAYVVPARDLDVHRETMRRFPRGDGARAALVRDWMRRNDEFRRYVLRELRRRGPLRSRDLEDRSIVPWWTGGGWNDGKSLGRMLDYLWMGGKIAISGRDGNERLWDLAGRVYPATARRRDEAARLVEQQLRWRGIARLDQFGRAWDGRPPGWREALRAREREGVAVPVRVEGLRGTWYAHAEALESGFRPRTTLLSPFDKLISHRARTEELFGFRFRLEIYVPRAKREYGYFVLPILHGERLIGRIDPFFDRPAGVLRVNAVYAEPGAPRDAGPAVAGAIRELAAWLGAREISYGAAPKAWRRDLR
jgi:uncharacterized protein YcaQ